MSASDYSSPSSAWTLPKPLQGARLNVHGSLAVGVFFTLTLIYLALFLSTRIASFGMDAESGLPISRAEFLILLLQSPEFILRQWVGGDWARVQLADRLPVLLGAVLWMLACWAPGRCFLRACKVDRRFARHDDLHDGQFAIDYTHKTHASHTPSSSGVLTWGERTVFACACGLSLMSVCTLAVGLLGGLGRPLLLLMAPAACWAFEFAGWLRRRRSGCEAERSTTPAVNESNRQAFDESETTWHWYALAPFALVLILASLLPPWSFDARCYHLQAPKEFAAAGQIGFVPHNVYANMPLGAEMHALAAMVLWPSDDGWWSGALVGKVVIACCTLLATAGLFFAGRRAASPLAGAIAAIVYVSIPWVAYVSTTGLIDGVVGMYFALSLFAAMIWMKAETHKTGWLVLTGFLAGSAIACKYPALLFVAFPIGLFVLVRSFGVAFANVRHEEHSQGATAEAGPKENGARPNGIRQSSFTAGARNALWTGIVFAIAVFASSGLWFVKNAVLTGNPTYPLLYNVFGGATRSEAKDEQWSRAHSPQVVQGQSSFSTARAMKSLQDIGWKSNWLSPLVWPLCLAAVMFAPHRRLAWSLLAIVAVYFAMWWLVTHRIDRFWIPVLPVAALLAGVGATAARGKWMRIAIPALLLGGVVCNLLLISSRALGDNRLLVSYEHLRADLPNAGDGNFTRTNPAHRFLNRVMEANDKVLLVGDAKPFDLEGAALYNTTFDDNLLELMLRGRNRDERLAALKQAGVTYVFVYWAGIAEERGPQGYGFTEFVDRRRIRQQLVEQQRILIPIPFEMHPEMGEVFRVASE